MKTPFIDIAIPVYNEERRIERGIYTLAEFCQVNRIPANIIIADNGSRDRTFELGTKISNELPEVSITRLPQKGVGAALKQVWGASKAAIVGYMDVDLSTDLSHLNTVCDLFRSNSCDVVNGSRLLPTSEVVHRTLKREIVSRTFNQILQVALRVKFTDGMCGFKFLTRTSFNTISKLGLKNNEWFFNTELLIKAEWAGLNIREIPVKWTDDHDSKARVIELAVKNSKEIWRLRSEEKQRKSA